MKKLKITFAKQPLVARAVFDAHEAESCAVFEAEWKADKTVNVRRFPRTVRAGGTGLPVTVIVVRRKVDQRDVETEDAINYAVGGQHTLDAGRARRNA